MWRLFSLACYIEKNRKLIEKKDKNDMHKKLKNNPILHKDSPKKFNHTK